MLNQSEKANAYRKLHERTGVFLLPNPWDIGTARILAHLGFEALATTSAGHAFSIGQRDNAVSRNQVLEHIAAISSATDLPVNADLENGFGDAPEVAAFTGRSVAEEIAAICSATDLPVNADLENGFGDAPEVAAETIRLA